MTNVPDYRGRVESDRPQDFLHRIAAVVPGYTGYQDRERRRDADKELRMYLARRFREQQTALLRVQQQLARTHHLESIGEVDRLSGVLQRFTDKLETAGRGYAGLFDPIKIDTPQLDQLYTFDAALTDGLQQVTAAIDGIAAAAQQGAGAAPSATAQDRPDLPAALAQLGTVLDTLLTTWNHRNEVMTTGQAVPAPEFDKFRNSLPATTGAPTQPLGGAPQPGAQAPGGPPYQPYTGPVGGPPAAGQPYQPYSGPPESPSATSGPPTGGPADSR